jgi:hypothetical protein
LIFDTVEADVSIVSSVASARAVLRDEFDFAFLDVNIEDGKSYKIADVLLNEGVPFAFVSGIARDETFPEHLRSVPFLPKPYEPAQISAMLRGIVDIEAES